MPETETPRSPDGDELSQIVETLGLLKAQNERTPFGEVAPRLIEDLVGPRVRKAVEDITQLADTIGKDIAVIGGGVPVFVDKRWGGVAKRILLTDESNLVVQRLKGDGSGVLDPSPGNSEAYRLVPTAEAEATLTDDHYKIVGAATSDVAVFRQDDISKLRKHSVDGRVWVSVNGDRLSPFTLESKLNGDGAQVLWGTLGKEDETVGNNDERMQAWSEKIARLAPLLEPFGKCNMVALEYLKSKVR